jgi:hypothetical protein
MVKKGIKGIGANWFLFLHSKKSKAKTHELNIALHKAIGFNRRLCRVMYNTSPKPK